MRVYRSELPEVGSDGGAIFRVGKSGRDLELSRRCKCKACFGFVAPSVIDLRNRAHQQQVLTSVYQGIGWEVPRLLGMMPSAPDYYFDAAAQIRMDHWSQGRVVLVGDAGYCASPMSGQGLQSRAHWCLCAGRRVSRGIGCLSNRISAI